ncbi:MAG: AmmeMemoRadiSam system radical SAM enzyme [Conexivisphaerales archaeon]
MIRKAELFQVVGDRVVCTACARKCHLKNDQTGFCGVRKSINGQLFLLNYGTIEAIHMDPIEKKPLVHFNPGSKVLSVGTTGCSWMCLYCQNYDLSQRRKVFGTEISPEMLVDLALRYGAEGLAFTYNEPLIFLEYARDAAFVAKNKGLFSTFVSNGYATDEGVNMMKSFLDAITIDIKGNANKDFLRKYAAVPDPEPIFNTILDLHKFGVHVEITDLIVPQVGDQLEDAKKLSKWIIDNLGPDVPLHFLRFHPDYKMDWLPFTPVTDLEQHYKVAKGQGLNFVYIGNVPGNKYENTYCPNCGAVLIRRNGFEILEWNLDENNRCFKCGYKMPIVGKFFRGSLDERFYQVSI